MSQTLHPLPNPVKHHSEVFFIWYGLTTTVPIVRLKSCRIPAPSECRFTLNALPPLMAMGLPNHPPRGSPGVTWRK